jgi:hypothetical protein
MNVKKEKNFTYLLNFKNNSCTALGLVVDDVEWHFWEGYGVDPIPRYFDALQNAYVSINHVPFVTYVPIDLVKIPPINVARICEQLGASLFSQFTYDILTCNCNHFTNAVLSK